jgi:5,10-methylenetetrahydromethanopterin reductase
MMVVMDPHRLGLCLPADSDRERIITLTRRAEDLGMHSVWVTEHTPGRDPFVHAAAAAMASERLRIGIGLVNVWRQLPAAVATAAATLDGLAPGRLTLVLGPWHEPAATNAGASRHSSLTAMEEAATLVRGLLQGDTMTFQGQVFSARDLRIATAPHQVELLWAANGARAAEGAARLRADGILDGAMVNYLQTADRVDEIAAVVGGSTPAYLIVMPHEDAAVPVSMIASALSADATMRREACIAEGTPITEDLAAARVAAGPSGAWAARAEEYTGANPLVLFSREAERVLDDLEQLMG